MQRNEVEEVESNVRRDERKAEQMIKLLGERDTGSEGETRRREEID